MGRPGVGAGHRPGGRQRRARRVGPVACDRVGLGKREAARARHHEDQVAGREVAGREHGRVGQGRGPGTLPDGLTGGGHDRRTGRADHGLLAIGRAAQLGDGAVVGVAVVGDRPGIDAGHCPRGRQRGAGRVGGVAADRVGLRVHKARRTGQREDDAATGEVAARQHRRVAQGHRLGAVVGSVTAVGLALVTIVGLAGLTTVCSPLVAVPNSVTELLLTSPS